MWLPLGTADVIYYYKYKFIYHQDEMKPVLVNNYYPAGKTEENKIALKFL